MNYPRPYEQSETASAYYAEYIADICAGGTVIYESVYDSYQGDVCVWCVLVDGTLFGTSWAWGSCDYCDPMCGKTEEEILQEIVGCAVTVDAAAALRYARSLGDDCPEKKAILAWYVDEC